MLGGSDDEQSVGPLRKQLSPPAPTIPSVAQILRSARKTSQLYTIMEFRKTVIAKVSWCPAFHRVNFFQRMSFKQETDVTPGIAHCAFMCWRVLNS